MRYAGRLGGGTPTSIKYQAGGTFPANGIPAEVAGGGGSGLQMVETNTALQVIGLALDSATISNAQASDGSTTSRLLSVVVNPDAILRSKLSGSATNDTAITAGTVDTANTDGLACSTDVSFSSPSLDEGSILAATGPNAGFCRKLTSLSSADGVFICAMPKDSTTSDTVIPLPYGFHGDVATGYSAMDNQYVQLTGTFDQVNMSVAVDTDNVNFLPFKLITPADFSKVLTDLQIDLLHYDHLYGGQVA